jgi:DNA-binding XRE family transcriptional regulator
MNELKQFRKDHGLTQEKAAELLGYNLWSWRSYETGRRDVPLHLLIVIEIYTDLKGVLNKNT